MKGTRHAWGHTTSLQRREGEEVWTWGSSFVRVQGCVFRLSWVHSSLTDLKHKEQELGSGKGEAGSLHVSSLGYCGLSRRANSWMGGAQWVC